MTALPTNYPPWFPAPIARRRQAPPRATWLGPELGPRIRALREAGHSYADIAAIVGCSTSTAYRWAR